jgi:hypothetical protein
MPPILWHVVMMRSLHALSVLLAVCSSTACFQMTTVMKLNGDGSGTIEHRMLFTTQALAQLRQFSSLGAGRGQGIDPTSEQQAREMAGALGPGVTYVSSQPVTTPVGQGRDAVYAFTDVGQLRVAAQPAAPGGATVRAPGLDLDASTLTFALTHEANGNAVLHITVPEPALFETLGSNSAASQQLPMIKAMLAGAHVLLGVEPAGTLVKTSSPFVDGARVTLLEIDLDQVLKDSDALVAKLQAAKSNDEMKAVLKDVPGLKMPMDREITIEFTPRR